MLTVDLFDREYVILNGISGAEAATSAASSQPIQVGIVGKAQPTAGVGESFTNFWFARVRQMIFIRSPEL
jgi:hypothetical protein